MRVFRIGIILIGGLVGVTTAVAQTAPAATGAKGTTAKVASLTIALTTKPSPPKAGMNDFVVTLKDAKGQPIAGAEVSVVLMMPAMPMMKMAEMRNEVKLKAAAAGTYQGTGQVMTPGTWNVTVSVKQAGKEIGTKKLTIIAK